MQYDNWMNITENTEQDEYDILECRRCGAIVKVFYHDYDSKERFEKRTAHKCKT